MSLGHGSSIVRNGLVLHIDAANPKSYSGTGVVWKDLSGNGLDLVMQGSLSWNSSGYFSGWSNTNYFERTNSDVWSYAPLGDSPRTVIAIAQTGTISGYQHILHYGNGGTVNQTYGLSTLNGALSDHRWGTSNIASTVLTSANHYMLSTRHSNTYAGARLGINTSFQDVSTITTAATTSGQFRVGIRTSVLIESWPSDGRIYSVAIYNRALSDVEVQQNFEALRGRYGI
jgi:hypothetical protein